MQPVVSNVDTGDIVLAVFVRDVAADDYVVPCWLYRLYRNVSVCCYCEMLDDDNDVEKLLLNLLEALLRGFDANMVWQCQMTMHNLHRSHQ